MAAGKLPFLIHSEAPEREVTLVISSARLTNTHTHTQYGTYSGGNGSAK